MMKNVKRRKKNAIATEIKRGITKSDNQIGTSSATIVDVPEPIFIDILLRLPVKGILVCKCICKRWRRLILSPHFAHLHFAQSKMTLLLRNLDSALVPRICYLIDPSEIDIKSCWGCGEETNVSLNVKLKIPIRNPEMALDMETVRRDVQVNLRLKDHKFRIVNSCNGFLCLSETSANEPAVVCNPVTGEYINIPYGKDAHEDFVDCGFGFCPTTNQYKVIRIFDSGERILFDCPLEQVLAYTSRMAEVYTLGTQSWKNVGYVPSYYGKLTSATYLNGRLHWLYPGQAYSAIIFTFDFTKERFQNFPSPSLQMCDVSFSDIAHMSIGIIRGNLCICLATYDSVTIWVMEKYGVQESWTKLVNFRENERGSNFVCQPIDYLNCGSLLMFYHPKNLFIHYNVETKEWNYLKVCGTRSKCEGVLFVPSFFSLNEAVVGNGGTVLNIGSCCGKIKLQGERRCLHIKEEGGTHFASTSPADFTDVEEWDSE